jgi:hypothetical protein
MLIGTLVNVTLIQRFMMIDSPYGSAFYNYNYPTKYKPKQTKTEYVTCLFLSNDYMLCDNKLVLIPKSEKFIDADVYIEML